MRSSSLWAGCLAAIAVALAACNNVGDCPAKGTITNGGSCSGDSLTCPYTLTSSQSTAASPITCDTSCTCTQGSWVCPDPTTCLPPAAGDDGGATGDDGGATGDDGGGTGDDGGGSEGGGD